MSSAHVQTIETGAPQGTARSRVVVGARVVLALALLGGVTALALLPMYAGPFVVHIFILALLTGALGISYRPLLLAAQVSIAHGTFYSIGAYTTAILVVDHGAGFWIALACSALTGALAALIIGLPSLRTAGAYFFLITFAFSVVATSLIENSGSLTGGFRGIAGIPFPPGVHDAEGFFYVALLACAIVGAGFWVLDRSRWGLELRALGSAPDLAQAAGVARFGTLLGAFVLGAACAGVLGGLYASYIGFIAPQSFDLWLSVSILTAVIVGGRLAPWGPLLGAAIVTLLPQAMHWEGATSAVFGAGVVILVMMAVPRGLATEITARVRRALRLTWRPPARPAGALAVPGSQPGAPDADRPEVLLSVEHLDKAFGGVHAARDVSFTVSAGETLGLVGPNGSGKTTTFNLISGFARPDGGRIRLGPADVATLAPHHAVRHGLTRSFQASATFEELTVFDNVLLACGGGRRRGVIGRMLRSRYRSAADRRLVWETLDAVGLADVAAVEAGSLSYGRRKLLGLAIGLATRPSILCLDEPATGMTDAEIDELVAVLRTVRARHRIALVIIEHRLALIRALCDRVIVLSSGAVLAQGDPDDVLSSAEVVEAYIGKAPA